MQTEVEVSDIYLYVLVSYNIGACTYIYIKRENLPNWNTNTPSCVFGISHACLKTWPVTSQRHWSI